MTQTQTAPDFRYEMITAWEEGRGAVTRHGSNAPCIQTQIATRRQEIAAAVPGLANGSHLLLVKTARRIAKNIALGDTPDNALYQQAVAGLQRQYPQSRITETYRQLADEALHLA
jgi:hypothetical protein